MRGRYRFAYVKRLAHLKQRVALRELRCACVVLGVKLSVLAVKEVQKTYNNVVRLFASEGIGYHGLSLIVRLNGVQTAPEEERVAVNIARHKSKAVAVRFARHAVVVGVNVAAHFLKL